VEGHTNGDAWLAGWHVSLSGPVRDDVAMAGISVSATAPIGGDLRAAGRDVAISGPIGGEAVIFGSSVQVLGTASIAGDLIIYAEEITMNGTVGGKVSLHANRIVMNGHVVGAALLEAAYDLKVGEAAVIEGTSSYRNVKPIIFPAGIPNAKYEGVLRNEDGRGVSVRQERSGFGKWAMSLAMAIVAGLAFFLISRRTLKALAEEGHKSFWSRCGLAFLTMVALPITLIITICTIIGIPVALLAMIAYGVLCLVAWALVGTLVGILVSHRLPKLAHREFDWLTVVGGTVVLHVVTAMPILGGLIGFVVFLAAQGVVIMTCWRIVAAKFGWR